MDNKVFIVLHPAKNLLMNNVAPMQVPCATADTKDAHRALERETGGKRVRGLERERKRERMADRLTDKRE